MIVRDSIFREYDIRGVVDRDLDTGFARNLGRSFALLALEMLAKQPKAEGNFWVGVGKDCRLSGDSLQSSLIQGLREGGLNVVDCGMGPTPQLYFSVFHQNLDAGIQVTGSHNPGDQNGFKMMIGKTTLSGDLIQKLRTNLYEVAKSSFAPVSGRELRSFDAHSAYIADLIERSKGLMGGRKLKVVVDGGNGVGGMVGPAVLRGLGCNVVEMYTDPDGRFPNHHPDPTVLENIEELRSRVVSEKADLGIAWDGDADRIGVVDEHGEPIFGDMLLLIYGRQLLKEVQNPTIIADVKCSEILFSQLEKEGAKPVMAKTGHSLIKAKLKELNAELAGEMSGHIFFAHRYFGFDDALHASARLVEILSNTEVPLSGLLHGVPKSISTPEIRVDCPDEIKFEVVEQAKGSFSEYSVNTLDGVRVSFAHGWGLVRASNTQAVLVLRFEADTADRLEEYQTLVESRIASIRQGLQAA